MLIVFLVAVLAPFVMLALAAELRLRRRRLPLRYLAVSPRSLAWQRRQMPTRWARCRGGESSCAKCRTGQAGSHLREARS